MSDFFESFTTNTGAASEGLTYEKLVAAQKKMIELDKISVADLGHWEGDQGIKTFGQIQLDEPSCDYKIKILAMFGMSVVKSFPWGIFTTAVPTYSLEYIYFIARPKFAQWRRNQLMLKIKWWPK